MTISFNATLTNSTQPGTIPDASLHVSSTTSNGIVSLIVSGSASIPNQYRNQAPYNDTGSVSISGSYSNDVSRGSITLQIVPGISSPYSSFLMNYNGNSNSITATGNTTFQYGTYQGGVTYDQSTISQLVTHLQNEINATYLNTFASQVPYAGLSVSQESINANYGSSSALISANIQLSGNISALPAAFITQEYCPALLSTGGSTYSSSGGSIYSQPQCESLFSALSIVFSSIKSYSYNLSYSNGIAGFQVSLQAAQNINLTQLTKLLESMTPQTQSTYGQSTTVPYQLLNSTKFNLSHFKATYSESQQASGEYTVKIATSGLTVYPPITRQGNQINMSSVFEAFNSTSSFPGNFTLVGGTDSAGTVHLALPPGAPTPTSSTANSATWSSIQLSQLANVELSSSSSPQGTTGSTSSTYSSTNGGVTTSTGTSASKGGGVPEFPFQIVITAVFTLLIVASYLVIRRHPLERGPKYHR